ncbi:MAG: isoleucine--tRNA ligase, partial [Clostridia bacterium]|nr:isoleucine--tRNA ligase [Clostridia bacterium]
KYIGYKLKPQLKTLGPKYGKKLGAISAFLANCNAKEIVSAVKNGGTYEIAGEDVILTYEDLQIFTESANGFVAAEDRGITVALDTALTDELIFEGVERELVSKIQNMRKDAGFEVTDRIDIYFTAEGIAQKVLKAGGFAADVLAASIKEGTADGFTKEQNVNGDKATITIIKK